MCVCVCVWWGGGVEFVFRCHKRKVAEGNIAGLHESSFQWFGHMCLTLSLPCHLKTTNKTTTFDILKLFCVFFALACERIFIKTHSTEIRFVTGPGNILFAGG